MNGWIIHKKALGENHEVKRLVEEFENQGVKIRVVNPRVMQISLQIEMIENLLSLMVFQENYLTLYYQEQAVEQPTLSRQSLDIQKGWVLY